MCVKQIADKTKKYFGILPKYWYNNIHINDNFSRAQAWM